MRTPLIALLLIVIPTLLPAAEMEPKLKDGAWNITLQAESAQSDLLPTVQMICLTRQEPVPISAASGNCRILSKDIQGDTVYWVAECREAQGVTRSVGNATYDGTRVEGGLQMTVAANGKPPEMRTFKLTGRRQGTCR